jgi:hypothetical protein
MTFRITALWAYVSVGPDDQEGVCAADINGMMIPLIGADETRVRSLLPYAEDVGRVTGLKIRLAKFTVREDIMDVGGVRQ